MGVLGGLDLMGPRCGYSSVTQGAEKIRFGPGRPFPHLRATSGDLGDMAQCGGRGGIGVAAHRCQQLAAETRHPAPLVWFVYSLRLELLLRLS